ncbi:MAG TPA: hypothetical protein PLY87_01010, partial [Planctomycetaceae bacterium]|nr:hypothetical protein [Planctomycetaceae bacterium]
MINWNINISETTLAARAKKVQTTLNEHRARHLDALLKNADSISPAMRAKAIAARNYLWMSLLKTVDVGLPVTDPNDDTKAEDLPHDLRPGYRRLSQPIEIKVDFDLTEGAVKLAEERGISERRLRAGIAYRLMQCFDTKPNSIPVQIANRDSTAMLTPFKDRFRKAANLNRDHITVGDLVLASAIGPLFAKAIGMELQRVTYVGGLYRAFEKASEGVSWTQLIEDVLQGGN